MCLPWSADIETLRGGHGSAPCRPFLMHILDTLTAKFLDGWEGGPPAAKPGDGRPVAAAALWGLGHFLEQVTDWYWLVLGCMSLPTVINIPYPDLLKHDYLFALSKLFFFADENAQKIQGNSHRGIKMVKMHYFSSLFVNISSICTNLS